MRKTRFFACVCCIALCACAILFCACQNQPETIPEETSLNSTNPNEDSGNSTTPSDDVPSATLPKLEGTIYYSGGFSEGKALVGICENTSSLYCINKAGEIVCEFKNTYWNNTLNSQNPMFYHGLIYLSQSQNQGVLGTETGRIITPEEMNVSLFSPVALKSGYIIADILDENSKVLQRGIMNTSFEWVVEPNETLTTLALNYSSCYGDFLYSRIDRAVLNLKTGEISNYDNLPTNLWQFRVKSGQNGATDIVFYSNIHETEKVFELTGIVDFFEISAFSYEKAAIYYYNDATGKYSFSMLDTKGNILFAPIELGLEFEEVIWDDTCIVYQHKTEYNEPDRFYSYDFSGNLLGTMEMFGVREAKMEMEVAVSDGVIIVSANAFGYGITSNRVYIYDKNFQLLFQEEIA